jgi:tetratricopeptide (TPR) repeat protein
MTHLAAAADAHAHLGHLFMRRGEAASSIEHLRIALAHADQVGDPIDGLFDRLNLASALIVANQPADALETIRHATPLANQLSHTFLQAGLSAAEAEAMLMLDDLSAAQHAAELSLRTEEEVHRPYALTVLGRIHGRRGEALLAGETLRAAIASAQETKDRYAEAHAWQALGEHEPGEANARAAHLLAELGISPAKRHDGQP